MSFPTLPSDRNVARKPRRTPVGRKSAASAESCGAAGGNSGGRRAGSALRQQSGYRKGAMVCSRASRSRRTLAARQRPADAQFARDGHGGCAERSPGVVVVPVCTVRHRAKHRRGVLQSGCLRGLRKQKIPLSGQYVGPPGVSRRRFEFASQGCHDLLHRLSRHC